MLTEEEKNKIRAEMEYRRLVEAELQPSKGRVAGFWAGCAHPVIVTVIGGILLTATAALFQCWSSIQQSNLNYERQLLETRYRLIEKFCAEFESDMTLLTNIRRTQLFLLSGKDKNPLGRSKDDALEFYYDQARVFQESRHPQAALSQINALFTKAETLQAAQDLREKVLAFLQLEMPEKSITEQENVQLGNAIMKCSVETHDGMLILVKEMGNEIREQKRTSAVFKLLP